MAAPLLAAQGLGKCYHLYARRTDRLKELLFHRPYGRPCWALRDLDLAVRPGEALGVIGRNGSGKSTLLQILAGVLPPTTGTLERHGRVAALLELGSGFDPNATGRENVLLNGAILGVPARTMRERFDAIVEFAEIGEFIDQPLSVYSSGMLMRLAFAVATNVEADCLLIDEALAVGDVFFRQKCYRHLDGLRARGVAIVLVSHAMPEVKQFCERAIVLEGGRPVFAGPAGEAVQRYYLHDAGSLPAANAAPAPSVAATPADGAYPLAAVAQVSDGSARCCSVTLLDAAGRPARTFAQGERARVVATFEVTRDIPIPSAGVVIQDERGTIVHGKSTLEHGSSVPTGVPAGSRVTLTQDIELALAVGDYTFQVSLGAFEADDFARRAALSPEELGVRIRRCCVLPRVGWFAVGKRTGATPVQLLHHGVADLPGSASLEVAPPGGGAA